MRHDPLNDALVAIKNAERLGKERCVIRPKSKLLVEVLKVLQREGYVGNFEAFEDRRGGWVEVELLGRINECGAIKPRFSVKSGEFVKWEQRYLPARDFGSLVLSTSRGVLTHKEAKEKGIGGVLLAYVY